MQAKTYKRLADAVTVFHFAWTFLVFGGAIAMVIFPAYALTQIIVLSITLISNIPFKLDCPVTLLERRLRRKIDPDFENHGSFMTTYINKIFGTHFRVINVNITIGILYVVFYTYAVLILINNYK